MLLGKGKYSEKNNKTKSVVDKKVGESANDILTELDSMVGLDEVKRDVRVLASFIQVNNLRRDRGLKAPAISKHLVLTGNPGTGKTTVARMISRIYYYSKNGVLHLLNIGSLRHLAIGLAINSVQ